jgi:dUTP pyrophosphatase
MFQQHSHEEKKLNDFTNMFQQHSHEEKKLNDYATLYLHVKNDNHELVELYKKHVEKHNENIMKDEYPNSGFDLFIPHDTFFENEFETLFVDLEIKTEMIYNEHNNRHPVSCGYYVYPRSSMSKTPLMLANHTGIIDSGYRGNLIAALRYLRLRDDNDYAVSKYKVEKHTRLLQICHPSLCPIVVKMVSEGELSITARGSDGFGSTGKIGLEN